MSKYISRFVVLSIVSMAVACSDQQAAMESARRINISSDARLIPEEDLNVKLDEALARLGALEKALSQEAAERKEADEVLQKRVGALETGLVALRAELKAEILRLDAAIEETRKSIDATKDQLLAATADAKKQTDADLKASVADENSKLIAMALLTQGAISNVETKLKNLEDKAAREYSTKAELQSMNAVASSLAATIGLLDKKIDDNALADAQLAKLIDVNIKEQATNFADQIQRLDTKNEQFEVDLRSVADEASNMIADQAASAQDQANVLLRAIGALQAYNLDNQVNIQLQFESLQKAVAGISLSNSSLRTALNAKFAQLDKADVDLATKFQDALLVGLKKEQDARGALSQMMEAMKLRVDDISKIAVNANKLAEQGVALAKANEAALSTLSAQVNTIESGLKADITAVSKKAEALFTTLDSKYQAQVGQLTARLSEAELRIGQLAQSLNSVLGNPLNLPADAITGFEVQSKLSRDTLVNASNEMAEGLGIFEAYFRDAMNIVNDTAEPSPSIARKFVASVVGSGSCTNSHGYLPSEASAVREQPAAGGLQWYRHLAAVYMKEVFFGVREAAPPADISMYLGLPKAEINSLGAFTVLALLPNYSPAGTSPGCQQAINDWGKSILFGAGADAALSATVRARLKSALLTSFSDAVLKPRLASLNLAATKYQDLLTALLSLRLVGANVPALLQGTSDVAILPRLALILADIAKLKGDVARMGSEFENMKGVLAAHAISQGQSQTQINTLMTGMNDLRTEMANKNKEQDNKIMALSLSLQKTLALVSVLAGQAGRADVAMAAVSLSRSLQRSMGTAVATGTGGILSATFSFPYVAAGTTILSECTGATMAPGGVKVAATSAACAGIMPAGNQASSVTVYRNGGPWQTFSTLASFAQARGSLTCEQYVAQWKTTNTTEIATNIANCKLLSGGTAGSANLVSIQGGKLNIEVYGPSDPIAKSRLAVSAAGMAIPADLKVEPSFLIAIGSNAQVAYLKFYSTVPGDPYFLLDLNEFTFTEKLGTRYYLFPASFVFSRTASGFWLTAQITGLSADLKETGTVSYPIVSAAASTALSLYTYSPIVVNLDRAPAPRTSKWSEIKVVFDLNGDGRQEQTGWIAPGSFLLALDLNRNGKIDDGRELFGTATRLPGILNAENGYQALAQYDKNNDGVIDSKDRIFKKLLLWDDRDQNGLSSARELKSMSVAGITSFSLQATPLTGQDSKTHEGSDTNRIYYKSMVHGPKACGREGCSTFDVWFNSIPLSRSATISQLN